MNATANPVTHAVAGERTPSFKQYRFAAVLLDERDTSRMPEKWRARIDELRRDVPAFLERTANGEFYVETAPHDAHPLGARAMRTLIDALLELPKTPEAAAQSGDRFVSTSEFPGVADGRYAVETDADDAHLAFYRVSIPDEDSRWHGRVFVKVMASDNELRLSGTTARAVLAKIANDPGAAARRYGHEIGQCGVCGRTLTDAESREWGIGPVCRAKTGW